MNRETFLDSFGHIADAPSGVDKLRSMVLDLAVRGQLSTQHDADVPAVVLLGQIAEERAQLVTAGAVRKAKSLGPVTETEETFLVPPGWSWTRFGNLFSRVGAGSTPTGGAKAYVETGVMFLRSQNVHNEGLALDGVAHIPSAVHERMSGTWVQGGDILLNITGASIGRSAVVPTDGWTTANVNQHVSVLRPLARETTAYLHALIVSPYFQNLIAASSPGASREGLAIKRMEVFPIPLPPAAEQQRIVERVRDLMRLCDQLEQQQTARTEVRSALTASALNRVSDADSMNDLRVAFRAFAENIGLHLAPGEGDLVALNRIRQTILDLAVRGRLTHQDPEEEPASGLLLRIAAQRNTLARTKAMRKLKDFGRVGATDLSDQLPGGWEWAEAADFFVASDSGWSPQCLSEPAEPGEWGVLKTSAVSRGVFAAGENKKLPPALEPRSQLEVHPGEFVMIRASGSKSLVGRGAIVTETESHLMLSDKHIRLSFLDEASTQYWAVLNDSTAVQAYYSVESSGTSTMSNVTRDRVGGLVVAVPPLAEQQRIADKVKLLLRICHELEQQLVAAVSLRHDLAASVSAHAASEPSAT